MNSIKNNIYYPGQILTVGSHYIKIIKYLTNGGFAQIYKVEYINSNSNISRETQTATTF